MLGINESYYLNPHIDENTIPDEDNFDSWVNYTLQITNEEHELITQELNAEENMNIIMLVLMGKCDDALEIIRKKKVELGL